MKDIKKAAPDQESDSLNTNDVEGNNNTYSLKFDWQKVLNYLLNIGSALSVELERKFAIRYAPSVIQRIERHGVSISSVVEPYKRKDGKISQLARYSISDGWRDRARLLLGEG